RHARTAARRSSRISTERAFLASGRSRVTTATWSPPFSTRITGRTLGLRSAEGVHGHAGRAPRPRSAEGVHGHAGRAPRLRSAEGVHGHAGRAPRLRSAEG